MLTDRELQSLRNMGNEAEAAADEIERLRNNADCLRQQVQDQAAEIERMRAAGARLYAAVGDALPIGPLLPSELKAAGQAWVDAYGA